MSFKKDNNSKREAIDNIDFQEIQEELSQIEEDKENTQDNISQENTQDNISSSNEEENTSNNNETNLLEEINALKDALYRKQADYENLRKRVERDREDMIYFIKRDILKKVIPWLDNIERIIKNTPEDMKNGAVFEGILAIEKAMRTDLEKMGVVSFESIGCKFDPDMHEVMTQVPGEAGIVVDEFEKGYKLGDKVLRVAKVVVGA